MGWVTINYMDAGRAEVGRKIIDVSTSNVKFQGSYISASSSMGELIHYWENIFVYLHSKYLIFLVIPIYLILWGCKRWYLRVSLLNKLEVFLFQIIRRILGVTMKQVKEEILTNDNICQICFDITTIQNKVSKQKLTFIVKVTCNYDEQLPTKLLTS